MAAVLKEGDFHSSLCRTASEVCGQTADAGVLVVTEEALEHPDIASIWEVFKRQPSWSELPLIVLARPAEGRQNGLLDSLANTLGTYTLLERPLGPSTLTRSVEVALRSRRRQYQLRELLKEQDRLRQELDTTQRLLHVVTSGARVGLVLVNRHYEYLFANDAYREVLGLPAENLVGRHVYDVLSQGWSQIQPRLDRALAGEQVTYELGLPPRPGTDQSRYFSVSYHPYRDAAGESAVVVGVMDITSRKNAEQAVRRAKAFDEAIMLNMAEGLYTVDSRGCLMSMNPAAERMFGWTFEELRGRKMHDVTHYKYRDGRPMPAEECAGLRVLREGVTLRNHEDTFLRKDGTFFDVVYSSSCLREGEQATGLVVVFHDITERKRAEQALRRAEQELRDLVENGRPRPKV